VEAVVATGPDSWEEVEGLLAHPGGKQVGPVGSALVEAGEGTLEEARHCYIDCDVPVASTGAVMVGGEENRIFLWSVSHFLIEIQSGIYID
jgi:hypothetical protein